MGRGWKILIGVVAWRLGRCSRSTPSSSREKRSRREVTVPGGRILKLPGGELQVARRRPARRQPDRPDPLLHLRDRLVGRDDRPALERKHRVIAVDLRGFGGSEKPARATRWRTRRPVVAEALRRLGVHRRDGRRPLAGRHRGDRPRRTCRHSLVARLVIIDQAPDNDFENEGLPFTAKLTFMPVLGPALWQVTPDFAIKDGLGVAFAPGYDVPDAFVDDFNRMTYTSYTESVRRGGRLQRRDPARPPDRGGRRPAAGDLRRRRPDLRLEEGAGRLRARCPAPRRS